MAIVEMLQVLALLRGCANDLNERTPAKLTIEAQPEPEINVERTELRQLCSTAQGREVEGRRR